jgi:hypothetical protein
LAVFGLAFVLAVVAAAGAVLNAIRHFGEPVYQSPDRSAGIIDRSRVPISRDGLGTLAGLDSWIHDYWKQTPEAHIKRVLTTVAVVVGDGASLLLH